MIIWMYTFQRNHFWDNREKIGEKILKNSAYSSNSAHVQFYIRNFNIKTNNRLPRNYNL